MSDDGWQAYTRTQRPPARQKVSLSVRVRWPALPGTQWAQYNLECVAADANPLPCLLLLISVDSNDDPHLYESLYGVVRSPDDLFAYDKTVRVAEDDIRDSHQRLRRFHAAMDRDYREIMTRNAAASGDPQLHVAKRRDRVKPSPALVAAAAAARAAAATALAAITPAVPRMRSSAQLTPQPSPQAPPKVLVQPHASPVQPPDEPEVAVVLVVPEPAAAAPPTLSESPSAALLSVPGPLLRQDSVGSGGTRTLRSALKGEADDGVGRRSVSFGEVVSMALVDSDGEGDSGDDSDM
jgi:hypothetical protein